jgi:hypothetical protein
LALRKYLNLPAAWAAAFPGVAIHIQPTLARDEGRGGGHAIVTTGL